jgi:NAD(P)-dependent dehydrogenase (short-subunit alcohol dehydrogenase family)
MPDAAYRRIMSVNVDGVVFGTRALLPAMFEAGRGDIVVTASMAGLGPIAFDPVYGLTKHAVVGFVRSMAGALDLRPALDVCISAICPGFTDTNIITPELRQVIGERGLEIMTPEHVGDAVLQALHERVNGAQWVVWPGIDIAPYEWNPALPVTEAAT